MVNTNEVIMENALEKLWKVRPKLVEVIIAACDLMMTIAHAATSVDDALTLIDITANEMKENIRRSNQPTVLH